MKRLSYNKGFTVAEVLVAMAIFSIVIMGSATVFTQLLKNSTAESNEQISRIAISRATESLRKEFHNTALISPKEDMHAPKDGLYAGIYSFNPNPDTGIPKPNGCQHQLDSAGNEVYSIVRYTTLLNWFQPELSLRAWYATTATNTDIRLTYHETNQKPQFIFAGGTKSMDEIILMDADLNAARRYLVTKVSKVVTDKDPYDDTQISGAEFVYNTVKLTVPKSWANTTQPPVDYAFITNSLVYGAATNILCVNTEGSLIQTNEADSKTRTVLSADPSYTITRFQVRYFNSKSTTRLDRNLFYAFPASDSPQDNERRNCMDAVSIRIDITPTNKTPPTPIRYEESVLLHNFHAHRAPTCN